MLIPVEEKMCYRHGNTDLAFHHWLLLLNERMRFDDELTTLPLVVPLGNNCYLHWLRVCAWIKGELRGTELP